MDTVAAPGAQTPVESNVQPAGDAPVVPAEPAVTSVSWRQDALLVRTLIAVSFPVLAAAVMVGGLFDGVGGRIYAAVSGLLGLGLAAALRRPRQAAVTNGAAALGLLLIGVLMAAAAGLDGVSGLRGHVAAAAQSGDVLRPPVGLTPGWQAVIGWVVGTAGFVAGWVAIVVGRPALGILVPVPLAALGGVSVPQNQQVGSGIAVLALLAAGIGMLSTAQAIGGEGRTPLAYELRRALRSLPLVGAITIVLVLLSRASFLFPQPYIDPASEPQKPKTIPLSEIEDRVLFEVESSISGPWRIGSLDVYDGSDWRLPPFDDARLTDVPDDGVVDTELDPGVKATFRVAGLTGTVLPGLPNTVGIVGRGTFVFDRRSGNIRLAEGQLEAGLEFTVAAASLPTVQELRRANAPAPDELGDFLEIPPPPPAVVELLSEAPKDSRWETFSFLHDHVLDTVTAAGPGIPTSITPERVEDILDGSQEATPFEIIATEAMLARWAGIPSRIGYGFDGGDVVEERLQVRPKHGATFVEVWFPGHKWLPVLATPRKAKATVGDVSEQQVNPAVLPSEDIGVELFVPVLVPPESRLQQTVLGVLLVVVPLGLLLLLAYTAYPALRKAARRSRRRSTAIESGTRARIATAYAEWRDTATDYGYGHTADPPLLYLRRVAPDAEHEQLAWLVTRVLWGDLQDDEAPRLAVAAEELSRSLRRRLALAHPVSLRVIAAVSRLSLRTPWAAEPTRAPGGERPRDGEPPPDGRRRRTPDKEAAGV